MDMSLRKLCKIVKGSMFCCCTCNHKVSDMTQQLNNTSEDTGSSEASGPGGSRERFRWKGKLPILWYKSLNPRQGAQDFDCVTKHCFLKKQKLFSAEVRALTEFVLQIILTDVEGIWSGLSLQKPGDQMLEGQARGRHSALGGKRIERKSVPSTEYMPMYQTVAAEHINIVLR